MGLEQPPPAPGAPRAAALSSTQRWASGLVAAVLVLALAAVAIVQSRQYRLLDLTVQYQTDYLQVSLPQFENEFLRLRTQWHDAVAQGVDFDREALQERYDIFVSRISTLESEMALRVTQDASLSRDALRRVGEFVAHADRWLGAEPQARLSLAELRALQPELDALAQPLRAWAVDAAQNVSHQVTGRNALVREHNQTGIALTLLLGVALLVLAAMTIMQMRQLAQRQRGLELLAADLREARAAAEAASIAKSAFLANMSHEIRTPFQGLLGMLSLLRETGLAPRQLDYLRTAQESADHLLTILNDILDMSKLESGTLAIAPETVDLRRLVGDIESLMRAPAAAKGLQFEVTVDPELPLRIVADPTRVRQVLFNLLNNAIKFSDTGSVTLGVRGAGERIVFTVTDTGIGMSAQTLSQLFQRFTQGDASPSRRHGGTGLGLEISRNLARLMGGDLRVASTLGVGSQFVFDMPLLDGGAAPPEAEPALPPPGVAAQPLRVLVAEDHPVNRAYVSALLEQLGHAPTFVDNGQDAVHAAGVGRFDIVLMDLHMPLLDGAEAAQAIRRLPGERAQVPIVALTADAFPETRQRCLALGMNGFLAKPMSAAQLAAVLQPFVRQAHAAGPAEAPAVVAVDAAGSLAPALEAPALHASTADAPAVDASSVAASSVAAPAVDASGVDASAVGAPAPAPRDTGATTDAEVLDQATLAELRALLPQERVIELTQQLLEQLTAARRHFDGQPASRGRFDELRRTMHSHAGAAASLGLAALARVTRDIEHAAHQGDGVGVTTGLQQLGGALQSSRDALRDAGVLDDRPAPPAA